MLHAPCDGRWRARGGRGKNSGKNTLFVGYLLFYVSPGPLSLLSVSLLSFPRESELSESTHAQRPSPFHAVPSCTSLNTAAPARLRSLTLPLPRFLFGPACPPSSACRGTPSGGPIGKLQESSTSCAQLLPAPAYSLSGLTTFVQLIISPIELKMLPASRWMPSEVRVHLPAARSARS